MFLLLFKGKEFMAVRKSSLAHENYMYHFITSHKPTGTVTKVKVEPWNSKTNSFFVDLINDDVFSLATFP